MGGDQTASRLRAEIDLRVLGYSYVLIFTTRELIRWSWCTSSPKQSSLRFLTYWASRRRMLSTWVRRNWTSPFQ